MERCLIATDLDGTILPEIRTITQHTVETLRAAVDQGHIVMIATARPPALAEWVYDKVGMQGPLGLLNGAYLFHPRDEAYPIVEHTLDTRAMQGLLKTLAAHDAVDLAIIQYRDEMHTTNLEPAGAYTKELIARCNVHTLDVTAPPDMPYSRVLLHSTQPDLVEDLLCGIPGAAFNRFADRPGNPVARYSIYVTQADKWEQVWHVAQENEIPRERIYTFGDEWNDERMLREAGMGHALKDSRAMAYTDRATFATCEEDGVAQLIQRDILG